MRNHDTYNHDFNDKVITNSRPSSSDGFTQTLKRKASAHAAKKSHMQVLQDGFTKKLERTYRRPGAKVQLKLAKKECCICFDTKPTCLLEHGISQLRRGNYIQHIQK